MAVSIWPERTFTVTAEPDAVAVADIVIVLVPIAVMVVPAGMPVPAMVCPTAILPILPMLDSELLPEVVVAVVEKMPLRSVLNAAITPPPDVLSLSAVVDVVVLVPNESEPLVLTFIVVNAELPKLKVKGSVTG